MPGSGTVQSGELKFSDIAGETGYGQPYSMLDMYGLANEPGAGGLMYHNAWSMGINNDMSAKTAIRDPGNANADMLTSNWYNYYQDIAMKINYQFTNNSDWGVYIHISIWDENGDHVDDIFTGVVPGKGTILGPTTMETILTTQHHSLAGGYRIAVQDVYFSPLPGLDENCAVILSVQQLADTDGAGQGTNRTSYNIGSFSDSGPTSPPAPPPPATVPYTPTMAIDCSGNPIPWNKRTHFHIFIS